MATMTASALSASTFSMVASVFSLTSTSSFGSWCSKNLMISSKDSRMGGNMASLTAPPQPVRGLEQDHVVTALGGHSRCFHPRWASTDYQHLLPRGGRTEIGPLLLVAGHGVVNAGDGQGKVLPPDTALDAGDAHPDVAYPALLGLVGEVGVGDQLSYHAHQVHLVDRENHVRLECP